MNPSVRTRFAPSPTGLLHIGSARTALFSWLFARHTGGKFILRMEDTDRERSSKTFEDGIVEDLTWLKLAWDEGPETGGGKGPYRQSGRLEVYRAHAERLLKGGRAYFCRCTKERLDALKDRQIKAGLPPRYDGRCADLKQAEMPEGVRPTVRFKVPEKTVSFEDGVHGHLSFDSRTIGDFIIIGSDGIAAYNFAAAVDDALMEITDIIRGDDHISNTPRQILLFEALGFKAPAYSHIPLVLGPDKTPLGKRDAGSSLRSLRAGGYLPDAVINSIARLGWSPGDDFLTLDEMAKAFSIEKLSRSPSVFDAERLKPFNKAAIERMDAEALAGLVDIHADRGWLKEAISIVRPNAATINDIIELLKPFTERPALKDEAKKILDEPYAKAVIKAFRTALEKADRMDEASFKIIIEQAKRSTGEKGGRLFMPVRAALTGDIEGIELVNVLKLLGKAEAAERLKGFEG